MLIVIAEKEELNIVKELRLNNVPILVTGVGAINVINSLQNIPRDTEIINVGYAGSNNIAVDRIVNVKSVSTYHPNVKFNDKFIIDIEGDVDCYTSTNFVTETTIKEPCVFDMELAFIASLGFKSVKSYKKISDNLNYEIYKENKICLKK